MAKFVASVIMHRTVTCVLVSICSRMIYPTVNGLFQHCSMRFADGSNLRRHIQTHTNEKPHVCKQCGKAFARGSILKEHMRTHVKVEDMPDQCPRYNVTTNVDLNFPAVQQVGDIIGYNMEIRASYIFPLLDRSHITMFQKPRGVVFNSKSALRRCDNLL